MISLPLAQLITALSGLVFTCIPAGLAIYFIRSPRGISLRLALMLAGETVGLGIVTFFAWIRYLERYDLIKPETVVWMMWLVYSTAILSSIALALFVIKTNRQGTRRRKGDGV